MAMGKTWWFDGGCTVDGAYAHVYDGKTLYRYPVPGKQTSQRAELTALIEALKAAGVGDEVVGDSMYALHIAVGSRRAAAHLDLVGELRRLTTQKKPKLRWVPSNRNLADAAKSARLRWTNAEEPEPVDTGLFAPDGKP